MNEKRAIETAANMVMQFEGFVPKPYRCPAGQMTFGFGSLMSKHPDAAFPMDIDTAKKFLHKDLAAFAREIKKMVKVDLNANQFAALLSFVYNLGSTQFARSSLLELINKGKFEEAATEFPKWNKANINGKMTSLRGLSVRREIEQKKFLEEDSNGHSEPSKPLPA